MEDLSRKEYPNALNAVHPSTAVSIVNDRIKRIGRINVEIADWLQERRKVEEAYVNGLRKLSRKQPPDSQSELGVFTTPWQKIVAAAESMAQSHQLFAQRVEKDVEQPLRNYSSRNKGMQSISNVQANLSTMAKELEDAQTTSDKLSKRGGKASTSKVDNATSRLETANSQWDSQAPFIFEQLQALDESRLNHLRDVLTQYQTHETDQIERNRVTAEQSISALLEIDTAVEIASFSVNATQGKPKLERKLKPSSSMGSSTAHSQPSAPPSEDNASEHSGRLDGSTESKGGLKRLGTMLGRRRQSIHGGFARAPSPSKGFTSFSRGNSNRDGRPPPSPRGSSNNLREPSTQDNRLSALAEFPSSPENSNASKFDADRTNGGINTALVEAGPGQPSMSNGASGQLSPDLSDVKPPPGPPPSHIASKSTPQAQLDTEGFSVPISRNDPIAQAQAEAAAEEGDQPQFRLDIRNEPIREEDGDAQAALSNVASALRSSTLATPSRKGGTVRGRRDVRNTMFVPAAPTPDFTAAPSDLSAPSPVSSPAQQAGMRAAALAALSSPEHKASSVSDTQSIRSSHSMGTATVMKHPEMNLPGLNSSIMESVSVQFENDVIKNVTVVGEIALVYNNPDVSSSLSAGTDTIRLNNFSKLEAVAPNHAFVSELSPERPGEYTVELAQLLLQPPRTPVVAFKYKVHISEQSDDDDNNNDKGGLSAQVPVLLAAAWRPQGDKLGVVIEYRLNPAYFASGRGNGEEAAATTQVTLSNVALAATYGGARAAGCQTKPGGTHVKEKSLIYWRLGDEQQPPQKVVGRLVGAEGAEPRPGVVEARWEMAVPPSMSSAPGASSAGGGGSGLGLSRLDPSGKGKEREEEDVDPFADESMAGSKGGEPPSSLLSSSSSSPAGHWVEVPSVRKIVSGKYDARQV